MIKLSLQMSHITFLPQNTKNSDMRCILDASLQIHRTPFTSPNSCHSYLTSPTPQHHHIVQALPISPSPPSPTSALTCVVVVDWFFVFFQQSWVLWLNLWQILQKYFTFLFRFFFADSSMWSMTLLMRSFFFGRPFLFAADHDGQKGKSSSGVDIACIDFIVISVLQ